MTAAREITDNDRLADLRKMNSSLESMRWERAMLDIRIANMERAVNEKLHELSPVPVKAGPEWVKSDVKGTCHRSIGDGDTCGRKTPWKHRGIFVCNPVCPIPVSHNRVPTSEGVWKILLDEEVTE